MTFSQQVSSCVLISLAKQSLIWLSYIYSTIAYKNINGWMLQVSQILQRLMPINGSPWYNNGICLRISGDIATIYA